MENNKLRKIIHIDMDCFFAAVEERENPQLRNIPLAVGGTPQNRGVICTANYEARKFGVKSAMSSHQAMRLCPNLTLVKPNTQLYKEASHKIFNILKCYSDTIQPVSIDEGYLDVTNSSHCKNSATLIAKEITSRIQKELGLSASAGVAPNKFLAKIASDWNKPNGLLTITPENMISFIEKLPVRSIPGVGASTEKKLLQLGLKTCLDIKNIPSHILYDKLGKYSLFLKQIASGVDERTVENTNITKSLSIEETYSKDISDFHLVPSYFDDLKERFLERLKRHQIRKGRDPIKSLFIKIKYSNFKHTTLEKGYSSHFFGSLQKKGAFCSLSNNLMNDLIKKGLSKSSLPIRLLGLGIRFESCRARQLELFSEI